eukprot:scaffold47368_cov36-Tisochrysis_lutea.AAC.4
MAEIPACAGMCGCGSPSSHKKWVAASRTLPGIGTTDRSLTNVHLRDRVGRRSVWDGGVGGAARVGAQSSAEQAPERSRTRQRPSARSAPRPHAAPAASACTSLARREAAESSRQPRLASSLLSCTTQR